MNMILQSFFNYYIPIYIERIMYKKRTKGRDKDKYGLKLALCFLAFKSSQADSCSSVTKIKAEL